MALLEQAGFSHFQSVQTVLPENATNTQTHDIIPGHDQGAFVVLKAQKIVKEV